MRRALLLAAAIASTAWLAPALADDPPPQAAPPPPAAKPGTLAAALEAARATDYPRAEKELLAIRGGDAAAAQLALAQIMFEQGRYAEADKYATQAQGATATKLVALALKARVLAAQGKTAEAIKLLEPQKDAAGVGGRRVRLALGELLVATGHRDDAEPILLKFAEEYKDDSPAGISDRDAEGLAMVGRAMVLLRSPKDANKAFNESERVASGANARVETLLWRAELFLDKYDAGRAEELTREALKISPNRADLLVMLARIKLDQSYDFDAAEELTKKALAINPKLTEAYAVRAGIALRDMDIEASERALADGFAVNPNDLELWSIKAAVRFLADDKAGYEAAKKETLARNAEFARFYLVVADYAEWEHRYDDIIVMMKEAVTVDPKDGKAWAELGLTQLREADEDGGKQSLETAWKYDKFNVRAFNTLERLYKQWIPNSYDDVVDGMWKIRYPKSEEKILQRYVPQLLSEAWGSMKARYDFTPTTPIQVEMYSEREHFGVRTSGLPEIGIQGVCFGKVVAAMSPNSEPFNWGNVLWHELGHVFAIQLSKNHVPRWFTEGLSEYETIVRRPEWQRELDPDLYKVMVKNALPGAVDMNRAFTHASDELDVTVAYYAASQMIVYTADRFGFGRIDKALKLWGTGARTAEVIQQAFGVTPADYDAGYRTWEMNRLARYKGQFMFDVKGKSVDDAKEALAKEPNSATAHVTMALAFARAHKMDEAKGEIAAALKIDPNDKNAHYMAAKIAGASDDPKGALAHLQAIQRAGGDGYGIEMQIADIDEALKDKAGMKTALETAYRWDPTQSDALKGIYDLAHEEKRDGDELYALRKLAPIEQHDRRIWRRLLATLVDKKLWNEARKVGESAIFVDVENIEIHTNYARALQATGAHDKAIYELESAVLCEGKPPELATAHALLAKSALATGDRARAKTELDAALQLDPANDEAKGVKL